VEPPWVTLEKKQGRKEGEKKGKQGEEGKEKNKRSQEGSCLTRYRCEGEEKK